MNINDHKHLDSLQITEHESDPCFEGYKGCRMPGYSVAMQLLEASISVGCTHLLLTNANWVLMSVYAKLSAWSPIRSTFVVTGIESAIPNYRFWLSDLGTDLYMKNGLMKWIIQQQTKVCSCFIVEVSAFTSTLVLIFLPLILFSSAKEGGWQRNKEGCIQQIPLIVLRLYFDAITKLSL